MPAVGSSWSAEDRRAGHQDPGTRLDDQGRRVRLDSAVDLQLAIGASLVDHPPDAADLGQHAGQELLAAETRVDGHHQHQLEVRQDLLEHRGGRRRVDRHSRPQAQPVDLLHRAVQVDRPFLVDDQRVGPGLGKRLQVPVRLRDHQVNFQRDRTSRA